MSLFKNIKSTKKEKSGNIPSRLGIKKDRSREIIKAVQNAYEEVDGNISKLFDIIKAEKMKKNEYTYAYFMVGGVKFMKARETEKKLEKVLDSLKGLRDLISEE